MLNTEIILTFIMLAFLLATIAFVYTCVLTEPGMILGRIYGWITTHLPSYLHKPLISCEKCVVGQWSFWLYFYTSDWNMTPDLSQVIVWLYFVSQSIITVAVIKAAYYKITGNIPSEKIFNNRKIKRPSELCNN